MLSGLTMPAGYCIGPPQPTPMAATVDVRRQTSLAHSVCEVSNKLVGSSVRERWRCDRRPAAVAVGVDDGGGHLGAADVEARSTVRFAGSRSLSANR